MYNRKFDIKKDFYALNEMENEMFPIIDKLKGENKSVLKTYIRKLFLDQFKK